MKKQAISLALSTALGTAFVAGATLSSVAVAAQGDVSPFGMQKLDSGYQLAQADTKKKDGKCGEGKCGAEKKPVEKKADGACGGDKTKAKDGSCGAAKPKAEAKAKDGSCGGAAKAKDGSCGGKK